MDDRQTIHCLHCGHAQEISCRAISSTCRSCNKSLRIESLVIENYQARRVIETCGSLTIEKNGNVFGDRVICGSLVVRGHIRANVVSLGPVLVGPGAILRGNVKAPSIAVGEGAVLEGDYNIGTDGTS